MKITSKVMDSLKESVEKMALLDGKGITGYITEQTVMYLRTGDRPVLSPRDSLLYTYSSGSEVIQEKVKESKPKVKKRKKRVSKKKS